MVQNSIVQTYAEQKNKDVTSQQFLDYIKDLKQKYPNFTFEENTVVYNSLQEAQQAEQKVEQKKEQKKDDIPTGVHSNGLISLLMILISSIVLALTNVIKKREV